MHMFSIEFSNKNRRDVKNKLRLKLGFKLKI